MLSIGGRLQPIFLSPEHPETAGGGASSETGSRTGSRTGSGTGSGAPEAPEPSSEQLLEKYHAALGPWASLARQNGHVIPAFVEAAFDLNLLARGKGKAAELFIAEYTEKFNDLRSNGVALVRLQVCLTFITSQKLLEQGAEKPTSARFALNALSKNCGAAIEPLGLRSDRATLKQIFDLLVTAQSTKRLRK